MRVEPNQRCVSFDGDGDRIVFFYQDQSEWLSIVIVKYCHVTLNFNAYSITQSGDSTFKSCCGVFKYSLCIGPFNSAGYEYSCQKKLTHAVHNVLPVV